MTGDRSARGASSTSRPKPSPRSRRSGGASSTSGSTGNGTVPADVRPSKALGQNFLLDPNLAAAIARDASVGPGVCVVEIGAGLGALTVALADAGADRVLALEFDRALLPPLREAVRDRPAIEVVHQDATKADWPALLDGGMWVCCANLPYNVGTGIVLDLLEQPSVERVVVMLQREVAERLVATPAEREAYGAVSLRVAYRAEGRIVRTVPPEVFWPRPKVGSAVVRLERLPRPPVDVDEAALWRVVDAAFAERRKTMRNALRRLGLSADEADRALTEAGIAPAARPETLDLHAFARVATAVGA
jgi:16S rRNA (adenine1518-N6/adenine1519-N6)-dimethyltransferase